MKDIFLVLAVVLVCSLCFSFFGNPITAYAADGDEGLLQSIWNSIKEFFQLFSTTFFDYITEIWESVKGIGNFFTVLGDRIGSFLTSAFNGFRDWLNVKLIDLRTVWAAFLTTLKNMKDDIHNVLAGILTNLKNLRDSVGNYFSGVLERLVQFKDDVHNVLAGILSNIKTKFDSVISLLTSLRTKFTESIDNLGYRLVDFFKVAIQDIVNFFNPMEGDDSSSELPNFIGNAGNAQEQIQDAISSASGVLLRPIKAIGTLIEKLFSLPYIEYFVVFSLFFGFVPVFLGML